MKILRLLLVFALLAIMPLVSAQYYGGFGYGAQSIIDSVVQNLEPFLRVVFGGDDWTGYLLFEKILLFLLFTMIVAIVLENVPVFKDRTRKGILRLIAVIIGIIAVRNLNYVWIGTIIVQYQALFIAMAGILPFIIYWYFIKGWESDVGRKFAWVFFALIYLGLWGTTTIAVYGNLFLWVAIVVLVYAFFLDGMVHQWINTQKVKKQFTRHTWNQIAEINDKIEKITKQVSAGSRPAGEGREQIEELMKIRNKLADGRNLT